MVTTKKKRDPFAPMIAGKENINITPAMIEKRPSLSDLPQSASIDGKPLKQVSGRVNVGDNRNLERSQMIREALVRQEAINKEQALQNEIERQRNQEEAYKAIIAENQQSQQFKDIQANFQKEQPTTQAQQIQQAPTTTQQPTTTTPTTEEALQIDPKLMGAGGTASAITGTDLGLVGASLYAGATGLPIIAGLAPSVLNYEVANLGFGKNLLTIRNLLGLGITYVGGRTLQDVYSRTYKNEVTPTLDVMFESDDNIVNDAPRMFTNYDEALTNIKKTNDLGDPLTASKNLKELRSTLKTYESKLQNAINTSSKTRGNSQIAIDLKEDIKNLNDQMDSMEQYIINTASIPRSQQLKTQLVQG